MSEATQTAIRDKTQSEGARFTKGKIWGCEETSDDQSKTHVTDLHGKMHGKNLLISLTLICHLRKDSSFGSSYSWPSGNPNM